MRSPKLIITVGSFGVTEVQARGRPEQKPEALRLVRQIMPAIERLDHALRRQIKREEEARA